jgi:peptidoglycan/LPS O-acetylase OafA/YrhL
VSRSIAKTAVNVLPAYRADIDGLRALAVLAVLGFHAFPEWVPGGFVGVDVFFVISGYLISLVIFEGLRAGSFSYRDFYARRIRRIFPALAVVLLASMAASAVWMFPNDFRQMGKQTFGGAAFISNFLLARGEGYFHRSSQDEPLLHLWSLGIEEQFYLLWPLTAAFFLRVRALPSIIATLLLGSLAVSLVLPVHYPNAAFYLPISRFWELLLGSALAWVAVFRQAWVDSGERLDGIRNLLAILGTALILGSMIAFSRGAPFPGWRALAPTLGTALLIVSGPRSMINSKLLALPPLVFVGLISYPLYLWHWPILSFLHVTRGEIGSGLKGAALIASALLAWTTYSLLERPIRFGQYRRHVVMPLCALMVGIAMAGLAMRYGVMENATYSPKLAFVAQFEHIEPRYKYIDDHDIPQLYRFECDFYDYKKDRPKDRIATSCFVTDRPRSVLIWGDSFAQSLYYGLKRNLPEDVGFLQVATSGCRPALEDSALDPLGSCNRSNHFALSIVARQRPDVVIVAQRDGYTTTDWKRIAERLASAGARHVLVVGPLPLWSVDLNQIIARKYWDHPPDRIADGLIPSQFEADAVMKRRHLGVEGQYDLVSPIDRLCDARGCIAFVGPDRFDDLITFDNGHMTPAGSNWLGRTVLAPAVRRLLPTEGAERANGSPFRPD